MSCPFCNDWGVYDDLSDPIGGVQEVFCTCAKGREIQGAEAMSRIFSKKFLPDDLVEKWRAELAGIPFDRPKPETKTIWDWIRDPAL